VTQVAVAVAALQLRSCRPVLAKTIDRYV